MADGDGKLSDEVELRLRDEEGSVACVDGRQSKLISDVAGGGEVDSGLLKCRDGGEGTDVCLLYTSPSPRDCLLSRMPSSA